MDANNAKLNSTTSSAVTGGAGEPTGAVASDSGRQARLNLVAVWHFTRHLLEMVLAMMVGMGVLGIWIMTAGDPPGYDILLIKYSLMSVSMVLPMVAWMRYRGHPWSDGVEMSIAMVVPIFALVVPVALDVSLPGLSEGSLMMLSHVAMIAGMIALMLYRWDRYAHGPHCHHT